MKGVYALLDFDVFAARGVHLEDDGVVEAITTAMVAGHPVALQLRAKSLGADATLGLLRRMREYVPSGCLLVANDRADLAYLAPTDALHIGQDDLPFAAAALVIGHERIGVSTHNLAQLDESLLLKPLYVAFGPVYETSSKTRPDPTVGAALLTQAVERAHTAGIPLCAIGGIQLAQARELATLGVEMCAVISAITHVRDGVADTNAITRSVAAFQEVLTS